MKHLKPLKLIGFLTLVGACTYYSLVFQAYATKEIHLLKRKLVADVIQEDLSTKALTIDIKTKQTKSLEKLTTDELRRALWIMDIQKGQLQDSLDTIKSALDYRENL